MLLHPPPSRRRVKFVVLPGILRKNVHTIFRPRRPRSKLSLPKGTVAKAMIRIPIPTILGGGIFQTFHGDHKTLGLHLLFVHPWPNIHLIRHHQINNTSININTHQINHTTNNLIHNHHINNLPLHRNNFSLLTFILLILWTLPRCLK